MTSFRKIEEKDDIALIATGIYQTDKKLFDSLFKDKKTSIKVIYELIRSEHVNFYHKKFITIIYEESIEEIMGFIVSYSSKQLDLDSIFYAFEQVPQITLSSIILNKILTSMFYSNIRKDEYYLSNLYIFQKYRNKGYGSKLVEKSKQKARLNNARNILVDIDYGNENLVKFFEKFGFEKSKNKYLKLLGRTVGTYGLKCEL